MQTEASAKVEIIRRLCCTEGHLRGIAAMVGRGDDCLLILRQITAVQGALREITGLICRSQLQHSLRQRFYAAADDPARQAEWVAEVTALYKYL